MKLALISLNAGRDEYSQSTAIKALVSERGYVLYRVGLFALS